MTWNKQEAMKFAEESDAFLLWKSVSKSCPTRPDGKPNRPLAAFTMTAEEIEASN